MIQILYLGRVGYAEALALQVEVAALVGQGRTENTLLLLIGRYVPLALTLVGPVVVNIVLFHLLMLPSGLPIAGLTAVLWLLVFYRVRSAFAGLFQARVDA